MKICVLQVFIPAETPALAEIPAIIPVEGYKPVVVDTADNICENTGKNPPLHA